MQTHTYAWKWREPGASVCVCESMCACAYASKRCVLLETLEPRGGLASIAQDVTGAGWGGRRYLDLILSSRCSSGAGGKTFLQQGREDTGAMCGTAGCGSHCAKGCHCTPT